MAIQSFPLPVTPKLSAVSAKRVEKALAAGSPFDAVVVVTAAPPKRPRKGLQALDEALATARSVDAALSGDTPAQTCIPAPLLAGGRLVVSTTGRLERYYDDVRRFAEAGEAGLARARSAGAKRPLLVVETPPRDARYRRAVQVALLAAVDSLWEPLEARRLGRAAAGPAEIGLVALGGADASEACTMVSRIAGARSVTRDLAGTEPEQMNPERFAAYCSQLFTESRVTVEVLDDVRKIRRGYPLLSAVARASLGVRRHAPRIIRLEYRGSGKTERTLLFAGKGVTYDTGGADLKTGGHMAGMSRDKGGAAAVAGFFQMLCERRPKNLHAIGLLGVVRNSVGADSYVTDEVIASRAGVRVRVGNTDAEGRLVLADLLGALREEAEGAPNPALFSIATLTGHAYRAVGPYTLLMSNGEALKQRLSRAIQTAGEQWGDPCERSTIRRDDYSFVAPRSAAEDLVSCNSEPSSGTARGHQFPFAFLDISSGIQNTELPFVHIDIGGSAVAGGDWQFGRPTAAPLLALTHGLT